MTDRTYPDSGRATGQTHIIRYALELGLLWIDGDGRDKVREALDALDALEVQLEAIGAGGVSGPLMGRAALSANAGEPVAWQYRSLRDNGAWFDCTKERFEMRCTQPEIWETRALYAAPPTAQAEGWRSIETAPKDSGYLLLRGGREQDVASGYWLQSAYAGNGAWIWPFVHMTPRLWAPLPPTTSAGSGKWE